jgi:hypothetical protein
MVTPMVTVNDDSPTRLRPMTAGLVLLVVAALWSPLARAQVAVAVTVPDQNPSHRDLAAGIVEQVASRWAFVHPPLATEAVALCRTDVVCLRGLATTAGASHLLLIGVAGLGTREAAVTTRLLGVDGTAAFEETDVISIGPAPRADGVPIATRLLGAVPSMPPPNARVERAPPETPPWAMFGTTLVGAGAVVAAAGFGVGLVALADPDQRDLAMGAAIGGGTIGAVAALVGAAFVVVDTVD